MRGRTAIILAAILVAISFAPVIQADAASGTDVLIDMGDGRTSWASGSGSTVMDAVADAASSEGMDAEYDGAGAVVAAGDHDAFVVCPSAHDCAPLQCRIDIAADAVPGFGALGPVSLPPEIVPAAVAFEHKFLTDLVKGTGAGLGIGEIYFL